MEEPAQAPEVPQPSQPPAAQPPPAPAPVPPQPAQQWGPPKEPAPIPKMFLGLCVAGIILIACGVMILVSAQFIVDAESDPWDDTYDENLVKNVGLVGKVIAMVGVMLLVLGLVAPGFMTPDLNPNTRMGLFIAAGIIVGLLFGTAL